RQDAIVKNNTPTTAEAAGAAIAIMEAVLLHADAVAGLGDLHRDIGGFTIADAELAVLPILVMPGAPAAHQGLHHEEGFARLGIRPVNDGGADRAELSR